MIREERTIDEHIEYRWLKGDSLQDCRRSVKSCFGSDIEIEAIRTRFVALSLPPPQHKQSDSL